MNYKIISTGSKGNAVLINDSILIDCGVPWNKIQAHARRKIELVLLTHVHGDHFRPATARRLHFENPLLRFGCCEWMVAPLLEAGVDERAIHVYKPDWTYFYDFYSNLPVLSIRPFLLVHDVPNCGFSVRRGKESLFYATDTSTLDSIEAKNYDLYLIEANHTRADIEARIEAKRAAGKFSYEEAAARNHLSREQAEEWLARNAGPNSRREFLHQHEAVSA